MVAIGIGRFAYTPALPIMQQTFGLATAAAGDLASINYLGYLARAIFAGLVPAGRVRGRLLRTSLLLVSASTAAMAATTAFPVWLALRLLSGLAGAGVFVLASSAVLEELSRLGGTKLSGWFYSGVGLGIALSGLVVMPLNAFILQGQAWWLDWLLLGFLATVLVVPCWTWLPASSPESPVRHPGQDPRRRRRIRTT
jgi:MFS family permease